jgi:ABC-type transport system involved in multi-copper enzyme maturation permease subunit
VRRGDVVLARWIAAAAWAGAVHAVTFGVAAAGSTLIFGAGGDWGAAVGTALGAWGGEVVALALGIGAGFTAGSALGAVSLLFVGATADTAAWLATRALALGMAVTVQLGGAPVDDRLPNALAALLPHAALLAWRSDAVPAAAAVVGWTAVGLALGMWRLSRRDV